MNKKVSLKSKIKRFWISWYQPTEDYRPIYGSKKQKEPLNHLYWCSGQRCSDDAWAMCAVVDALNETAAKRTVKKYWPEATEWRFCDEKETDWMPNDRFKVPAES